MLRILLGSHLLVHNGNSLMTIKEIGMGCVNVASFHAKRFCKFRAMQAAKKNVEPNLRHKVLY